MKIAHTYCLPYYINKNETFVLMGIKKTYNKNQGYIHSNPGQLVLIGGNLKKNTSFAENVQIEFKEETGHKLDMKKIYIDPNYNTYFVTAYYKCSSYEFKNFDKLINKEERFPEMNKLCWISLDKVIEIMVNFNKNIVKNIDKLSLEYTNQFKNKKWNLSLEINELIWFIRKKEKLNHNIKNKYIVENYIHNKLNNKDFFNKVNMIVFKYISKNSKYDWFEDSLFYFKQYHQNIIKKSPPKKVKSPLNKKSPPKKVKSPLNKKSPPKKTKSPPKKTKYIPPHLRK